MKSKKHMSSYFREKYDVTPIFEPVSFERYGKSLIFSHITYFYIAPDFYHFFSEARPILLYFARH